MQLSEANGVTKRARLDARIRSAISTVTYKDDILRAVRESRLLSDSSPIDSHAKWQMRTAVGLLA